VSYILFDNQEAHYHEWRLANRDDGYILNVHRRNIETPALHCANCPRPATSRSKQPNPFTGRDYIKLCSLDVADLHEWTRRAGLSEALRICKTCNPPKLRNAGTDAPRKGCLPTTPNPEQNAEVEQAAMSHVTEHYQKAGYGVKDVSKVHTLGYDLECTRRKEKLCVEVKGLSGDEEYFYITKNEVEAAKSNPNFVLCVVTGARSGPRLREYAGRDLDTHFELRAITYTARRNKAVTDLLSDR
jgi:hypothetical protein